MWMMCLGGLGGRWGFGGLGWVNGDSGEVELRSDAEEVVVQSWEEAGEQEMGDMALSGEKASDSDKSDGDGVVGGVSMDGIGWSLKQADS